MNRMRLRGPEIFGDLEGDTLRLEAEGRRVSIELDFATVRWLAGHLNDWIDLKRSEVDECARAMRPTPVEAKQ